ncbi:hypothetical protein SAMN05518672_11321 [Chitinophaga sp. CF118]|uniref:hypothetical protein n=1 Tax=Chitinophaga sp. CF118 TaxID=1884367 RepID=UPI0008E086B3|nr:hypothetical protein [Chitinophaga sp. CF118]SFE95827.1 hypothetical protein SAMN05518672_11321 [Chitinophaga sp. CF118]
MKVFLTVLQLLFWLPALSQTNGIKTITAIYDTTAVAELYDRIPIGLKLIYNNGQLRQTEGFLEGNYRWNRIKVTTSNGSFQDGYLIINRKRLAEQQYKVILSLTFPDAPEPFPVSLALPYVKSIRFNHYADSLKRDIHFYLNVEGIFSSGKIFPLDTSAVKFEVSEGKMIGQDLLLDLKNTTTRIITVTAIYKHDPSIKAVTNIPVKQLPDDESKILPNNYNTRH